MAIYHLHVKVHSRSTGASAVARAAYRAREALVDERTGERHDYSRRSDLDHAEIFAPEGAPDWVRDRSTLWNAVEAAERRKDAQVAREIQIALPLELTLGQQREAVEAFVTNECVSRGMVADVAFHGGDTHNPHAHVLLTTRRLEGDGFGGKERAWNDRAVVETWREAWARCANRQLFERQLLAPVEDKPIRIDHRSLAAQRDDALRRGDLEEAKALDRDPDLHHGRSAWMEARDGVVTERGARSDEIDRGNFYREKSRRECERGIRRINVQLERCYEDLRVREQDRALARERAREAERGRGGWSR